MLALYRTSLDQARAIPKAWGRKVLHLTTINPPKGQASHILRHTFAAHFIMGGGHIVTLKEILGHASLAMTMRYSHLAPEHLNDAIRLGPMADFAHWNQLNGGAPLAYYFCMIFIETPVFTKRLKELLTDDSYASFQRALADRPDMGDVIEGTGGIRKVRVASSGHGKRGGSRVIYYHFTSASQIALLLIYPKNEKDDLSADERKVLKHIIDRWR